MILSFPKIIVTIQNSDYLKLRKLYIWENAMYLNGTIGYRFVTTNP